MYPVHLQAGTADWGLIGFYIETKRFSGVMSDTPKKPTFLMLFGQKRIFFLIKSVFLMLPHIVHLVRRLYCEFQRHRTYTAKLPSVLVQT